MYRDFIDSDGTEIDQDLELRIVPIAFTVRVLPFGQSTPVQPCFGGGLGIINWRYRETGEFVDFGAGREIFKDTFEDSEADGSDLRWRSSLRGPAIQCGWRDPLSARGGRSRETSPAPRSTSAAGRTTSRSACDSISGFGIRDRGICIR